MSTSSGDVNFFSKVKFKSLYTTNSNLNKNDSVWDTARNISGALGVDYTDTEQKVAFDYAADKYDILNGGGTEYPYHIHFYSGHEYSSIPDTFKKIKDTVYGNYQNGCSLNIFGVATDSFGKYKRRKDAVKRLIILKKISEDENIAKRIKNRGANESEQVVKLLNEEDSHIIKEKQDNNVGMMLQSSMITAGIFVGSGLFYSLPIIALPIRFISYVAIATGCIDVLQRYKVNTIYDNLLYHSDEMHFVSEKNVKEILDDEFSCSMSEEVFKSVTGYLNDKSIQKKSLGGVFDSVKRGLKNYKISKESHDTVACLTELQNDPKFIKAMGKILNMKDATLYDKFLMKKESLGSSLGRVFGKPDIQQQQPTPQDENNLDSDKTDNEQTTTTNTTQSNANPKDNSKEEYDAHYSQPPENVDKTIENIDDVNHKKGGANFGDMFKQEQGPLLEKVNDKKKKYQKKYEDTKQECHQKLEDIKENTKNGYHRGMKKHYNEKEKKKLKGGNRFSKWFKKKANESDNKFFSNIGAKLAERDLKKAYQAYVNAYNHDWAVAKNKDAQSYHPMTLEQYRQQQESVVLISGNV